MQEGMITTRVNGGTGDGGNIKISPPQFTILNKGKMKAQTDAGQGGNICIVAKEVQKK
ncbi:MAG: hypothetical protein VSS75_010680 [Candidatus Parabeggiatoa sp.]